jgi:AbiJ-like protein/TIR domain-containing protein
MPKKITEITRRDIRESLSSLNLWGRLEELEFLNRLYDLDTLPSHDSRFRTAREDITKHRIANDDWDNDWIFSDDRFGLKDGDDQILLRFLAELLHPVVRSNQDEVARISQTLNSLLAPDGYRLIVKEHISGRPVYTAIEIPPEPLSPSATAKHFTEDVRPLIATIARLAELDGSRLEQEVLRSAEPHLEQPEYDNWDGGTYYYTLTLIVPVDLFARLGDQVRPIEERISNRITGVLRAPDRHHVTAVVIQPSMLARTSEQLADVVVARAERPIPQFWAPGQFRLFISHVTSFRQRATALRQDLSQFHISGFVAHETIEPGELWQREIEAALRSMDAMAALITPDFHDSKWTDQEVGWALGSGVYVLPVRRGADPYGFLGEVQGIQGLGKRVSEVAEEIFETLLRRSRTKEALLEALVVGFERSESYKVARQNISLLERAHSIPESLLLRIEVAARSNEQVAKSSGVADRVAKLVRLHQGLKWPAA